MKLIGSSSILRFYIVLGDSLDFSDYINFKHPSFFILDMKKTAMASLKKN